MIALFYYPMQLPWNLVLWMVLPLCFSVALVYKTIRVTDIRRLPREALGLFLYIVVGLGVLGAALYLILEYLGKRMP